MEKTFFIIVYSSRRRINIKHDVLETLMFSKNHDSLQRQASIAVKMEVQLCMWEAVVKEPMTAAESDYLEE